MNPFKSKALQWWQISLLKISVGCVGIVVGATWPSFFLPHIMLLLVIGIGIGLYLLYVWYKK